MFANKKSARLSGNKKKMISAGRMQKLIKYLLPMLEGKTRSELDAIQAEIEKILGYDPEKVAKWRRDAKERDTLMSTLVSLSIN